MNAATKKACRDLLAGYLGLEGSARELRARAAELAAEEKKVRRTQRKTGDSIRELGGGAMLDEALVELRRAA